MRSGAVIGSVTAVLASAAGVVPGRMSSGRRRPRNTHALNNTNRTPVATRLAAVSTAISAPCDAPGTDACSTTSDPDVIAQAMPNTTRPCTWCRPAPARPRTPNVNRRFSAVLPIAVTSSARKSAVWAPIAGRNRAYRAANARVESTPIAPNRRTCPRNPT